MAIFSALRRVFAPCRIAAIGVSAAAAFAAPGQAAPPAEKPNIIFLLADDIGYGDLGCYGATLVQTPHCDRLAKEGRRFTDAHAPAATCTPTRYAFLTGEYAWRKPGTNILPGTAGLIITPGRLTVPAMLEQAGYTTGVVGKWHLGLGTTPTDYNTDLKPGPLEIGFDSAWLLPATGDRTPCVWVENHRVVNLDPADPIRLDYAVKRGAPRSFVGGIPRIGEQIGGRAALWKDADIADVIADKAVAFIERHKGEPFFLYLCTHDIHVPRVPHERFRGTSKAGVRGDAIHSFDWTVGRVMKALDTLGLADRTLLVVTSDNGGVLDTNGPDSVNSGDATTNNGHRFNGPLRGTKGTVHEGGTRVPFIARWPGRIPPGDSDALVCHVDMLASFASLTGQSLPADAGPDSFDVMPAFLGNGAGRDHLVEQGRTLALREGTWKLIPADGGGVGGRKPAKRGSAIAELYDLATDIGETKNLAAAMPERVAEMQKRLDTIRADGRSSTPKP